MKINSNIERPDTDLIQPKGINTNIKKPNSGEGIPSPGAATKQRNSESDER